MTFTGIVVSGIGQGARFLAVDWVVAQLEQRLGLEPFPGTLNLRVPHDVRQALFDRRHNFLRIADSAAPECPGYLTEVTLRANGVAAGPAYVILPEQTMYQDVLEIISPVSLRDTLAVQDGDTVAVEAVGDRGETGGC